MRPIERAILVGGLSVWLLSGAVSAQTPPATAPKPPVTPIVPTQALGREFLAGTWDYNSDESVDAATGRREQGPQGAAQRRIGGNGRGGSGVGGFGPSGGGRPPSGFGPSGGGLGGGGYGGGTPIGMGMVFVNETRELVRDLLEVPEQLRISLAEAAVTFRDDLDHELTYPTNNKKMKYQLGAAVFEAKMRWDGAQLKKEVEGGEGFKLTETYFLGQDGKRLFVILRVGDPQKPVKDAPIVGVNRVYDRLPQ